MTDTHHESDSNRITRGEERAIASTKEFADFLVEYRRNEDAKAALLHEMAGHRHEETEHRVEKVEEALFGTDTKPGVAAEVGRLNTEIRFIKAITILVAVPVAGAAVWAIADFIKAISLRIFGGG